MIVSKSTSVGVVHVWRNSELTVVYWHCEVVVRLIYFELLVLIRAVLINNLRPILLSISSLVDSVAMPPPVNLRLVVLRALLASLLLLYPLVRVLLVLY